MVYKDFDPKSIKENIRFFNIRPNKTNSSVFIEFYLWKDVLVTSFCVIDDKCMFTLNKVNNKFAGSLPYCEEKDMLHYFRLEEEYFNNVLKQPLYIYDADMDGVMVLKNLNALNNYIVEEEKNADYIYDAELMRTLKGKKYEKKRNRYNHFIKNYGDRYKYKKLGFDDIDDIKNFVIDWKNKKGNEEELSGDSTYVGVSFTAMQTLDFECKGILNILDEKDIFLYANMAGIYIDGILKAFAIGVYNSLEKMVVLSVLKADRNISGLYQAMMKEYLLNEFVEAKIVNLEDDAGLEGLRTLKMRYNPIMFAKKYTLIQNNS